METLNSTIKAGQWVCTFRSDSSLFSLILGVQIFLPEASNELVPASGIGNTDSEMSIDDGKTLDRLVTH